jgi:hypothetical protein
MEPGEGASRRGSRSPWGKRVLGEEPFSLELRGRARCSVGSGMTKDGEGSRGESNQEEVHPRERDPVDRQVLEVRVELPPSRNFCQ